MLNEQQLITASNETYLPNTSGLITAQRVRDFNNDDLIPTIFDISASLQNTINGIVAGTGFVTTQSFNTYTSSQTAESASFNGRVDALQTSTASLNLYTQSINAFTQSTNVFTSSYSTGSFTGSFSGDGSKLFGITASGAGVGILDEGIFQGAAVTLNFTGSSISASVVGGIATINVTPTNVSMFLSKSTFETYTASLDLTFATDASLSASASTLQDNINTLSSSVAVTDLAQSSSIAQLLTFSSSLDSTYATDTQLSASASTLQNNINTRLLTSSFNTYTASIVLGNYVTTASFNAYTASDSSNTSASINAATQSLSSSLATGISASIASVSASLTLTDNSKLESSSFNSYTASAATNTTASINAATQSLSASLSTGISASISQLSASTAGQLSTASFNSYTASASTNVSASINAATSSLSSSLTLTDNSKLNSASFNLFTASALLTSSGWASTGSNTFIGNQIISGNLDVTGKITALSASITYLETIFETASVIYSSGSNQLGDELSDVQTLSGSVKVQGGLTVNGVPVQTSSFDASGYLLTSSFNTYTQSAASNTSASINSATSSLSQSLSASIGELSASVAAINATQLSTSSFNTYTASASTNVSGAINVATQSLSSSIATTTSGLSSSIGDLSSSVAAINAGQLSTASFNSYTASQTTISQSFDSRILNISGTYATTASNVFTGLQTLNGGLDVNSTTTLDGAVTASKGLNVQGMLINTGSAGSANVAIGITSLQQNNAGDNNVAIGYGALRDASAGSDNVAIGRSAGANNNGYTGWTENVFIGKDAGFEVATTNNTIVGANAGKNALGFAGIGNNTLIGYNAGNSLVRGNKNTMIGAAVGLAVGGETAASASNHIVLSDGDGNIGLVVNDIRKVIIDSMYSTGSITASYFVGTASFATTASFALNGGGGSVDTGSLATTGSNTFRGNQIISGNVEVSGNISLQQGFDLLTHHVQAPAVNGVEIQNNAGNVVALFGAGGSLGTTFYGQINTTAISSSGNITGNLIGTASFATTASFALNATSVNTGSFITTGSSATTQNISGALNVSGNFTVVEQFPTINTNNTFFTSTGSTQLDLSIVRAGGGTNDVTNLRLQAISGSNTTDTVQSQLLVGNNNNTATFFSSSASINLSTVFATGSMGGRVSYSANVSVNAFSGSANVAITAPIVRMGQAGAQIAITGSNPTILSGSLSGSLVSTLTDIYPSTPQGNFIVTIDSASMATLIAGAGTNANTLYFVI
jgi:hypothetical protein